MMIFPVLLLGSLGAVPSPGAARAPLVVIEAGCSGGIAGRSTTVRIDADGRVSKGTRLAPMTPAGRITRDEVRALSDRLDAASFETLKTLPKARQIYDGVSCYITRKTAGTHTVQFLAGATTPDPASSNRYRATRGVMTDIMKVADRVALNPQPIPPEGKP
jgi:hypothetical protein